MMLGLNRQCHPPRFQRTLCHNCAQAANAPPHDHTALLVAPGNGDFVMMIFVHKDGQAGFFMVLRRFEGQPGGHQTAEMLLPPPDKRG